MTNQQQQQLMTAASQLDGTGSSSIVAPSQSDLISQGSSSSGISMSQQQAYNNNDKLGQRHPSGPFDTSQLIGISSNSQQQQSAPNLAGSTQMKAQRDNAGMRGLVSQQFNQGLTDNSNSGQHNNIYSSLASNHQLNNNGNQNQNHRNSLNSLAGQMSSMLQLRYNPNQGPPEQSANSAYSSFVDSLATAQSGLAPSSAIMEPAASQQQQSTVDNSLINQHQMQIQATAGQAGSGSQPSAGPRASLLERLRSIVGLNKALSPFTSRQQQLQTVQLQQQLPSSIQTANQPTVSSNTNNNLQQQQQQPQK